MYNLLDKIKESGTRVVVVSSSAHDGSTMDSKDFTGDIIGINSEDNYDNLKQYCMTKLQNILMSNRLSRELKGTNASSNSLHPGIVKTNLFYTIFNEEKLGKVLYGILNYLNDLVLMSPLTGSLTTLYVASSEEMNGVTNKYFIPVAIETAPSKLAQDEKLADKLWEDSILMLEKGSEVCVDK